MSDCRKFTVLKALLVASATLACAVEGPPLGGPIDDVPPKVVGTVPTSDSAGVDPGSAIAITFSEDMTRSGLERLFNTMPEIQIGTVRWDGRTIVIKPLNSLHPDTTYIARLNSGYRDNHKVPKESDHWWAFATSAAIDSGTISGTVYFRREPTRTGVARCFFLPVDSAFVPQASRHDRESKTDDTGKYSLRYLPSRGNRFIVWAFEDKNKNGEFDPGNEFGQTHIDTVVLTPGAPFDSDVNIAIVDPTEPASLTGVVVNRSGFDDSLAVTVTLSPDSNDAPAYLTACDTNGVFSFESVKMGRYIVRTFIDIAPDSVCGWFVCFEDSSQQCAEPCTVMPDTLTLAPGDGARLDTLYLNPADTRGRVVP
jgi:hypothetical protein